MTQPNEVMIFRKPIESPAAIITDTDIRVSYGEYWIDFRDGKILVRDDKGNRIALVHTNGARRCEQCGAYLLKEAVICRHCGAKKIQSLAAAVGLWTIWGL